MDHVEPPQGPQRLSANQKRKQEKDQEKRRNKRQFLRFQTRDVYVTEDLEAKESKLYSDNPLIKQRLLTQRQNLQRHLKKQIGK